MAIIQYAQFEAAQREMFESLCVAHDLDPETFQIVAVIQAPDRANGLGRVYVRRGGVVHDYFAGNWLTEFVDRLPQRLEEERRQAMPARAVLERSVMAASVTSQGRSALLA